MRGLVPTRLNERHHSYDIELSSKGSFKGSLFWGHCLQTSLRKIDVDLGMLEFEKVSQEGTRTKPGHNQE